MSTGTARRILRQNARSFLGLALVFALALCIKTPVAHAQANDTFYNENVYNYTGGSQNSITIELGGDQTANLDSRWYNSFASPNLDTPPSIVVSGGNTFLTFSGPDILASGGTGHFGYGLLGGTPEPHGWGSPDVLNKSWGLSTPNSEPNYNQPAATLGAVQK